jgi:aminoglycoside phosphotransferase (APT) family kinase protein
VDAAELSASLEAVLRDRLASPDGRVEGLARLSAGASRQTWSFEWSEGGSPPRPLILQRERPGGGSGAGMAVEADLIGAAAVAGVPVPAVVATGDELGAAFVVTERIEGETIPRKLLRDDEFAAARPLLARQAGEALAAVHTIPVEGFDGRLARRDQIEQFREVLDLLDEPHPAFELGFRWLERNRPEARADAVVHGDFRTGNLIVGPEGLRAVLDWELSHIGDPVEDLGWFCVRAWRFGSPRRAGGFGSVTELLEGYHEASGVEVDPEAVRWWEAMGTLKWGVICMVQASSHLGGATRSVELATIGRRTAENEHDLLELVRGRRGGKPKQPDEPEAQQPRPSGSVPHDRPTLAELVEAVREFLETEVAGATEGGVRFHARIAANALSMVERELALGPAQAADHAARLAALGVADDRELSAAIRSGAMDDRWDEVTAAVSASVADKLAVSHPGYTTPEPEPDDETVT